MEPGGRAPAPGSLGLVQAFINTIDVEDGPDSIERPEQLQRWLADQDLPAGDRPLGAEDVRQARAVREALRALAAANNGGPVDVDAVDTLNHASERAGLRVRFDSSGSPRLEPVEEGVPGALSRILAEVHTAMVDGTWPRLKACRNEACRWVFYDHSKNRSGTWCTMSVCGGKLKARAYRRRHRASA